MFSEVPIKQFTVKFPYEPYEVQREYMDKVITCLEERKFGLLESPTGTGKTLALLCASLAWLEGSRSSLPGGKNGPLQGHDEDIKALLRGEGLSNNAAGQQKLPNQLPGGPPRCRIVYASRTHSQLSQVIQEFRRCPYNHISSVILASRDQLCINESLATFPDKNQMCKVKRKTRACEYFNNIERAVDIGPESGIGDIESLRKHGVKRKLCPYYSSRDLAGKADLIFLPYNYLVDPRIRKSLAINLEECVVIVDEAHNVLRIFEDSSSISFSAKDVAVALSELDFLLDFNKKAAEDEMYAETLANMPNLDSAQVYSLKDCFSKFENGLVNFTKSMSPQADYTGEEVVKLFDLCGVSSGNASIVTGAIANVLDSLSVLNLAGGGNKGKGLTKMSELVDVMFLDAGPNTIDKMKSYYRFHVASRKSHSGAGPGSSTTEDTEFNLWCFHPGFSLSSLVRCQIRTLVLTSGTLKPIETFQAELGADFPIHLQNNHVINAEKQISYHIVSKGPDNESLISNFQSRSNPKYLNSLGLSLVEIAKVVPDGLLVFFPSYAWMDACTTNWKSGGVWERINHWKQCFVEPKDRNLLAKMVDEYRTRVRHPSRIGACFMAVCRGKVSEGIDFADADARAVVITGIPYPSVMDPKVNLKKKYLDKQISQQQQPGSKGAKLFSGAEWYHLEAFRAINQAVGRVIRHKDDFGAVLLLDRRFGDRNACAKLSSWLPPPQNLPTFKDFSKSLEGFFSQHQYFPKPKVAVSSILMNKQKRGTSSDGKRKVPASTGSAINLSQPLAKRKKIVIKSRALSEVQPQQEQQQEQGASTSSSLVCDSSGKPQTESTSTKKDQPKDIQRFVIGLKEKLDKKELKTILVNIRQYKEQGNVLPLMRTFEELMDKSTMRLSDIMGFRPFIRPEDLQTFDKIKNLLPQQPQKES